MPFSSFGELLKALRKRQRLTQKDLAARIGVHTNTISIWERGNYLPESKTLVLETAYQLGLNEQETRQFLEASLTALSPYWLLPFPRNPFFTGRAEFLEHIDALLHTDPAVALTQSFALHGLGGIGKTQLAAEYAYRYVLTYTAIFWIAAETVESIIASFLTIADLLRLPEREEANQQRIVTAVHHWLNTHKGWLLIWDNMEDIEILQRFLPSTRHGAILITTRCQALGTLAQGIELHTMTTEEAMLLLLRRAKVLAPEAKSEQMKQFAERFPLDYEAAQALVTIMGGLPLALDQAGAYIEETGCSVADYLQRYQHQCIQLLDRRGMLGGGHPQSVTTTFRLIYQRLAQEHPLAADLLHLCALLHAEAIPEELFTTRIQHPGAVLEPLVTSSSQLDLAIATLRTFSLVQRYAETHTLSIHRLVQTVFQEVMSESERKQWQQRAIYLLNALFPEVVPEAWQQCERYLPHVLTCATSIPDQSGEQDLAGLLCKTADYLRERARYEQAEAWYLRARLILEQALELEHPQMASLLNGLGKLAYAQGKYQQAEPLFQQARHIWEQTLGPEHPQVALALNNLAILYAEQGKYEQAEVQFHQAQRISEHILGPEHPQIAISLNNLAILSSLQGKDGEAEAFYQRALTIREQHLGLDHPETARSLAGLALLYEQQSNDEQAELLLQHACTIFEQRLGQTHPEAMKTRNNYQSLLERRRRAIEALIEEQQEDVPQNSFPLNMPSEEAEDSEVQEPDPQTLDELHQQVTPNLRVTVRGRSDHIAYTRIVRMREVTFTCIVCGKTVTQLRYPSGRVKYCSDMCKEAGRVQKHEERVRKQREKRRTEREMNKQAQMLEV